MKIKNKSLELNNLLAIEQVCKKDEVVKLMAELKKFIIDNDLYPTGPVVYQILDERQESRNTYKVYIPINASVKLSSDSQLEFINRISLESSLSCRVVDEEDLEMSKELLKLCAEQSDKRLIEPFYYVYLDGYGDPIFDIFSEIQD
ncbi:DUF5085 family protein [Clostridium paraputrificum]|uniref:DUF5085 family protein n=1 Tax=Clostridium TaxID=1485 RepID=UPI00189BFF65|nr:MULTISPECIES: DUF5085 family protein [Clostridium]MDB2104748.1 DUF5085 family protein [Clostridium paraputrificum]MDC0803347.1 DUF5085 family protein [Clostridium paraputrificum]MDU1937820.1 DUF5085 family protein [Clostridium sp.]MDU2046291.1 DUF5085 family protein [Clostridium sp.]